MRWINTDIYPLKLLTTQSCNPPVTLIVLITIPSGPNTSETSPPRTKPSPITRITRITEIALTNLYLPTSISLIIRPPTLTTTSIIRITLNPGQRAWTCFTTHTPPPPPHLHLGSQTKVILITLVALITLIKNGNARPLRAT